MAAPAPQVIHACYNKSNGTVHIVNASSDCRRDELPVSWNVEGPAGPKGATGCWPHRSSRSNRRTGPHRPCRTERSDGSCRPHRGDRPRRSNRSNRRTGSHRSSGPHGTSRRAWPHGSSRPCRPGRSDGSRRPHGRTGSIGPAGPAGPAGVNGEPGPAGPAGPAGPSGTTGIFGSNILNFRLGQSGGAECTLGSIMLNVSTEYPTNYLPADGSLIDIQTNTALFSLIGINYGGNGTSNFRPA